jgi:hypothetical protein
VNTHRDPIRRVTSVLCGAAIQLNQRAKRSGYPPMIAIIRGNPSAPARTNDSGVPPIPSQIGSVACSGRG